MAHQASDESGIYRATTDDPRQRGIKRPRPRAPGVGNIEHNEIGLAATGARRCGEAGHKGGVFFALEQIAAGIIGWMQKGIGARHTRRERARQKPSRAFGSAIGVGRRGEIGGSDGFAVGLASKQILDAGAVCAGRSAEDAREGRSIIFRC